MLYIHIKGICTLRLCGKSRDKFYFIRRLLPECINVVTRVDIVTQSLGKRDQVKN